MSEERSKRQDAWVLTPKQSFVPRLRLNKHRRSASPGSKSDGVLLLLRFDHPRAFRPPVNPTRCCALGPSPLIATDEEWVSQQDGF